MTEESFIMLGLAGEIIFADPNNPVGDDTDLCTVPTVFEIPFLTTEFAILPTVEASPPSPGTERKTFPTVSLVIF